MIFRLDCDPNIGLTQSSQDAIKAVLMRNALGERYPSCLRALYMAEEVAGLDLQLGVVIPPKKTGLITPSACSSFVVSIEFSADKPKVSVEKSKVFIGK